MISKDICITTWYGTENYGSNLQAMALRIVLSNLGYNPSFLGRFRVRTYVLRHPVLAYSRIVNKFNGKRYKQFFNPSTYELSQERKKRLEAFKAENFRVTSFYTESEWKKAIGERMIFMAGSDIIWNPARGYPMHSFLDFAYCAKLPRFSYATSIGAKELPKQYYRAYKRYLGSMVEVGVREQSTVDMLEPIVGRKITKVVDPTLLLTEKEWDAVAEKAELSVKLPESGYILCYFVMDDPRYWSYMRLVKEMTGLEVVVLPMHSQDENQGYITVLDGTPYEFVRLIKNAEIIVTDSFHACVFSLIYNKEFYLMRRKRKAEDAKYDDFLNRYHLQKRQILDETKFQRDCDIDYAESQKILQIDRQNSMEFLKTALEECNA